MRASGGAAPDRPRHEAEVERAAAETSAAESEVRGSVLEAGPPHRLWRVLSGFGIVLAWILITIGFVAVGIGLWSRRTFGVISYDQLLTNLPGGGGEGAGGSEIVTSAILSGIVVPAAIAVLLLGIAEWVRRRLRRREDPTRTDRLLMRCSAGVVAVLVPVLGLGYLGNSIGLGDYVAATVAEATGDRGITDYYVAPDTSMAARVSVDQGEAAHAGGTKSNLILIYLESVEDAFSDDARFEKNMLEPIETSTEEWESIPKLRQYEGGGWTMSGIVSTQCGIPLRTAGSVSGAEELNQIGADGNEVDEYLPGATCLGDVLANEGYRNVFLGGADARFAGKGSFLASHGYDEVKDLNHWKSVGETEIRGDWGLSDRRLFERAREEVAELRASGQPFNLTMLSLDTHEAPRVYDYCNWDTETAMTSITFCSMEQVAGFVDALEADGVLEDTVVVVMGDHQKMVAKGGSFFEELHGDEDRSIFNRVWTPDPGGVRFARQEIDQFSMYPTILELLDVELSGHRAGIGVSALVSRDEAGSGTVLDLDEQEYRALVNARSTEFFAELWADGAD